VRVARILTRRRKLTRSKYRRDVLFQAAYAYRMSKAAVQLTPGIASPRMSCLLLIDPQCAVRARHDAAY
jgi:hypothetical protein